MRGMLNHSHCLHDVFGVMTQNYSIPEVTLLHNLRYLISYMRWWLVSLPARLLEIGGASVHVSSCWGYEWRKLGFNVWWTLIQRQVAAFEDTHRLAEFRRWTHEFGERPFVDTFDARQNTFVAAVAFETKVDFMVCEFCWINIDITWKLYGRVWLYKLGHLLWALTNSDSTLVCFEDLIIVEWSFAAVYPPFLALFKHLIVLILDFGPFTRIKSANKVAHKDLGGVLNSGWLAKNIVDVCAEHFLNQSCWRFYSFFFLCMMLLRRQLLVFK